MTFFPPFGDFLKSEFFFFLETFQLFPDIASGLALGISFCASVSVLIVVIRLNQLLFGKNKTRNKATRH